MLQPAVPLRPRNGNGVLRVAIIGRISTEHQNIENISASYRYVEAYLSQIYQGPVEVQLLGEQASGMLTTRASIRQAESLVADGAVDLVIAEDLSRIYRNPRHQYDFVQNAVDAGTRVICIGDHLDTADENWEVMMGAATLRHGLFIPDTRRRVRRTATNSFRQGGMVGKICFGYRKLSKDEAASGAFGPKGLRLAKLPECTSIIRDMRERVLAGQSYASIADWLNGAAIQPGPYATSRYWTGRLVKQLLRAPILSGTRSFRNTIYEPIFRTGEHRRRRNEAPELQQHPELAHLTREEHETLWRAMDDRAVALGAGSDRQQKRRNVPRSRSIYPGQSIHCAACGGFMYHSGKHLRCQNSLPRSPKKCWNHVQVASELVRHRLIEWLCGYCDSRPAFRQALVQLAAEHWDRLHRRRPSAADGLEQEIRSLESQAANLAKAIALGGDLEALIRQSQAVDESLRAARQRLAEDGVSAAAQPPPLKHGVAGHLQDVLERLARESFEFADVLRRVFPSFRICPVQALDTPQVRPKGKVRFDARCLTGGQETQEDVQFELELFVPPQHILHLAACVAARRQVPQPSLRAIAERLGIGYMTVKRALAYARLMERAGLEGPYRELRASPREGSRWRKRRRESCASID